MVSDLGGASLLTLDGRLLQDSPFDGLGEIASVIQRRMVLFLGAQEIPELARVLPRRTPDAVDCVECERTGWLRVKADFQIPCARCGGLGWVDDEIRRELANRVLNPTGVRPAG